MNVEAMLFCQVDSFGVCERLIESAVLILALFSHLSQNNLPSVTYARPIDDRLK
jgi:hypothetical protein